MNVNGQFYIGEGIGNWGLATPPHVIGLHDIVTNFRVLRLQFPRPQKVGYFRSKMK